MNILGEWARDGSAGISEAPENQKSGQTVLRRGVAFVSSAISERAVLLCCVLPLCFHEYMVAEERKEVIIIEIVARVADQGVITLCRMHDILRAADGSISFEPGDTGAGHIGDYVVDAMGALLLSSRAERHAATKELRRAAKLGKLIKGPRPPWAEQ